MTNFTTETQSTQRKPNRRWTQIYADRMESLRPAQGNLPVFWALDNEIA
jgi:hypothetical protein